FWLKRDREKDNVYLFSAEKTNNPRFEFKNKSNFTGGKYQIQFHSGNSFYPAIGEFKTEENKLFGTFLTETGDYRFLEGNVDGDSLKFSGFDGAHAYLFHAKIFGDSISGFFKASHTHLETFTGKRNNDFQLANPDSLTFIKEGFESFYFKMVNLQGDSVSFTD